MSGKMVLYKGTYYRAEDLERVKEREERAAQESAVESAPDRVTALEARVGDLEALVATLTGGADQGEPETAPEPEVEPEAQKKPAAKAAAKKEAKA